MELESSRQMFAARGPCKCAYSQWLGKYVKAEGKVKVELNLSQSLVFLGNCLVLAQGMILATTDRLTHIENRISQSKPTISADSSFRLVGLIRSPITQNGRSNPITTSLVAELTRVSVIPYTPTDHAGFGGRCFLA